MITKDNFKQLIQPAIDTLTFDEVYKLDNCLYVLIELHTFNIGGHVSIETFDDYSPNKERYAAETGNLYLPIEDFLDLCNEFNVDLNP